jgi:eukaryotic-like serine/threonine-protein kinase
VIDSIIGDRYRVVRLLGAGGMGSVYEATDVESGRRVAVKVITADQAKNRTLMGRFEREAKAATGIATPHIVRVEGGGVDAASGFPYLVMELLEGEDVLQLLRRLGPLPPDLALRIAAQACIGLQRAHDERIVHRDIKPANLFLARGGRGDRVVKLLDFGIAKIKPDPTQDSAETAGLTNTGSMLGSPLYMSPEQARGHRDLDFRADIWSMGVVLYQVLSGRTPHQESETLGELIISICTELPPPLQEVAPWVRPEVAAIVHGAMRLDPTERFQTAAQMLAAIQPLLSRGFAITEETLAALPAAERATVAPPLAASFYDTVVPRRSNVSATGAKTGARGGMGGTAVMGPMADAVASTGGAAAQAVSASAGVSSGPIAAFGATVDPVPGGGHVPPASHVPVRSGRAVVLVASVLVVILGVGAGFLLMRFTRVPAPSTSPASSLSAPVSPPVEPSAAAREPAVRRVTLVVLPAGVSVEINGAPVTPKDDAVEINGALGSVHHVRLFSGAHEARADVVVTESGAMPAKVELALPAAQTVLKGPAPRPRPSATTTSAPDIRITR